MPKLTAEQIESGAKAMFELDWPKDKWERLGPGRHQDRYKAMFAAGVATIQDPLEAHFRKFFEEQDIRHVEQIYQSDNVITNAYEFIDGIGNIIGYQPNEDEDE